MESESLRESGCVCKTEGEGQRGREVEEEVSGLEHEGWVGGRKEAEVVDSIPPSPSPRRGDGGEGGE